MNEGGPLGWSRGMDYGGETLAAALAPLGRSGFGLRSRRMAERRGVGAGMRKAWPREWFAVTPSGRKG